MKHFILKISFGILVLAPGSLGAVTQYYKDTIGFTRSQLRLKSSLNLPLQAKTENIKIPLRKLKIRALKSAKDERIDPVQIYVPRDHQEIRKIAKKIARRKYRRKVEDLLIEKIKKQGPSNRKRVRIDLAKSDLKYVRLSQIADVMSQEHRDVRINTKDLNRNRSLRSQFLSQIRFFLDIKQRKQIIKKLKSGQDLSVEDDLLPRFAEKMVKKFIVYRGPNCFHAALAFHDQAMTRSPAINVKEEPGYHRAMINYDELWRVINRHFYEVDPQKSPLKYGDMLVFFSTPRNAVEPIDFRWIRHTSTYLFSNFTFSKGSKSPNTPYTVKTLDDEWKTWSSYAKNLGVKVYRRNSQIISKIPPTDLVDWIY